MSDKKANSQNSTHHSIIKRLIVLKEKNQKILSDINEKSTKALEKAHK